MPKTKPAPSEPDTSLGADVVVKIGDLVVAAHNAALTASKDSSRDPIFQAVKIEQHGKALEVASTDSFRLSVTRIDNPGGQPFKVIVDNAAQLGRQMKQLQKDTFLDHVRISVEGSYVSFWGCGEQGVKQHPFPDFWQPVQSDIRFPNYRKLLPTAKSMRSLSEFKGETVAFNPKFLADVGKLRNLGDEDNLYPTQLRFWASDSLKPTLWTFGELATAKVTYLLMPVRIP